MNTSLISAALTACALGLSLAAIWLALSAHWRQRKDHRHPTLRARIGSLELDQAVTQDELAKLVKLVKRRANREAVAASRAKRAEDMTQGTAESDADWVKRKNQELVLGRRG